ncbi:MAG: response regulator [Gammaproteobacteria bacterium]|nr:response regulator [Rhodocyclaceae bacterium]MBU3909902.1 response regulator [Gammaproteobacteria bacterium]MBU3988946.1 response regulator [Gammaproteobacteria bacterium]MBU4003519.1 response regulator [Gammaproteobacteria bacterium]MBU4020122.1 response regulator [Gammaproteobacteria bacterium]
MQAQQKTGQFSLEAKVRAAFLAAVVMVLVSAVTMWKVSQDAMEATHWVAHTHEILENLSSVNSDTLRIELGTQSFRISGDPAHLAERDAAIAAREVALLKLKDLAAHSPSMWALWVQLRATADERLAIAKRSSFLRETQGLAAASAYVASAPLHETRERMARLLAEMQQEESRLLAERITTQTQMRERLVTNSIFVVLALLVLLAATFVQFRQQIRTTEASRRDLATANERVQAILDAVGDGLHGIDRDGNIVFANPVGIAMLGWDPEELIGRHAHPLMHHTRADGSPYPAAECNIYATMQDGVSRQVEDEVFWRKDGSSFPVAYTSVGMRNEAGESTGVLVSFHDITARKQAEQSLIAAKNAAELANRAKDSFLATMSHEIRTPLGGLLGMLELLALSPLNREQNETLQTAQDSGHSLLRILNDILDWSKIEEGKLELAPQAISLRQLVAEVANTYAHVASASHVKLTQQVDAHLAPAHSVDPLRLSQVLNNFVSNAIKFSHGGKVELRAALLERGDGTEQLRFSVKDTGIGIEPAAQQRLFQCYGQANADTARMYGGTGLGLAICRRLADLLGGRIELESTPGQGSTFSLTLTLPIAEAVLAQAPAERIAAQSVPLAVQSAATANAPLILVVDDHPINRKLLARQLGLLGLRVTTAENGEAALALWRAGDYALIITDCHMPVLDGYALTRAIRASETAKARPRTPIFAWTANALADESEKCRVAGMDELLVKPADLPQLQQMLAKWRLIATEAPSDLAQPSAPPAAAALAVDVNVLKVQIGNDMAIVCEFLQDFRASATMIAAELAAASAAGDAAQVGAQAHKLKSAARAVGAQALAELCTELETAGRAGRGQELPAIMLKLDKEMAAVDAELADLMARHATPRQKTIGEKLL